MVTSLKRTFGNDFIIRIFPVAATVHTTILKLHQKMNIIIKKYTMGKIMYTLTQLNSTQLDSAHLGSTQLDSARLSLTQLDSARLSSTQLDSARLSLTQLDSARLSLTLPDIKTLFTD